MPDALFLLGKSYDPMLPDSARLYYARVAKEYPASLRAPTALYKLGNLELRAGNTKAARAYWQQIVDKYKLSDEYGSAQDRLRENLPSPKAHTNMSNSAGEMPFLDHLEECCRRIT